MPQGATYAACFGCGRSFLKSELKAGKLKSGPKCASCAEPTAAPMQKPIRPAPQMAASSNERVEWHLVMAQEGGEFPTLEAAKSKAERDWDDEYPDDITIYKMLIDSSGKERYGGEKWSARGKSKDGRRLPLTWRKSR